MEDFSKRLFGEDEEKDSEEESDIEKKKSTAARKIGAFAKQTVASNPRSYKTERLRNFFGEDEEEEEDKKKEKIKKTPKEKEETPEEPVSKTEETAALDAEAIEEAKRETALSHIDTELEALETEGAGETQDPIHAFLTDVRERLESGETAVDPVIEQEAQKRLSLAAKKLDDIEEVVPATPSDIGDFTRDGEISLDPPDDRSAIIPLQKIGTREDEEDVTSHKIAAPPLDLLADDPSPTSLETDSSHMTEAPGSLSSKETRPLPFLETEGGKETRTSKSAPNPAGALFVAGYMIGRRGGRKRTEARLEPQVEKLKKEVATTTRLLESNERALRRVADETAERKRPSVSERQIPTRPDAKLAKPIERTSKKIVEQAVVLPEQLKSVIETTAPSSPEKSVPRIQAEQPRPSQQQEKKLPEPKESPTKEQREKPVLLAQKMKKIEQLSTPELIKEAEHLYIDGASIRTLYNVNRIDRTGLIKIVQESTRGGDIAAVFTQVEIGRERQRERAKEFRHDDTHLATSSSAQPGTSEQSHQLGRILMQDIRPTTTASHSHHPKLHVPENADSSDLDATHQDTTPKQSKHVFTLTISAVLAIFLAIAMAIIFLG